MVRESQPEAAHGVTSIANFSQVSSLGTWGHTYIPVALGMPMSR